MPLSACVQVRVDLFDAKIKARGGKRHTRLVTVDEGEPTTHILFE